MRKFASRPSSARSLFRMSQRYLGGPPRRARRNALEKRARGFPEPPPGRRVRGGTPSEKRSVLAPWRSARPFDVSSTRRREEQARAGGPLQVRKLLEALEPPDAPVVHVERLGVGLMLRVLGADGRRGVRRDAFILHLLPCAALPQTLPQAYSLTRPLAGAPAATIRRAARRERGRSLFWPVRSW